MATPQPFNLTRAAYLGRQTIKFGSIALVALIIGRFAFTAGYAYYKMLYPDPPPPPTVGFGVLPTLRFPEQTLTDKPSSYEIEIPQSRLPDFGDRAKVFLMTRSSLSLLADQRAKEIAANYGYVFTPTVLSNTLYRWTKSTPIQSTLEMNVRNFSFDLTSDFLSRSELLTNRNLPNESNAVSVVKAFVNAGQQLPNDIATSSGYVSYYKSLGGELEPAVSLSDADFLRVDIPRFPIDGDKRFFTPDGDEGALHGMVTGALTGKDQIVDLHYHYQPIDYTERHTYPLRTVQSAWQIVQAGEAYVANPGTSDIAVIRNVVLGYYDDPEEQDYMQPIYVFEGDGGFLAYVPAIDPLYYQSTTDGVPIR